MVQNDNIDNLKVKDKGFTSNILLTTTIGSNQLVISQDGCKLNEPKSLTWGGRVNAIIFSMVMNGGCYITLLS